MTKIPWGCFSPGVILTGTSVLVSLSLNLNLAKFLNISPIFQGGIFKKFSFRTGTPKNTRFHLFPLPAYMNYYLRLREEYIISLFPLQT